MSNTAFTPEELRQVAEAAAGVSKRTQLFVSKNSHGVRFTEERTQDTAFVVTGTDATPSPQAAPFEVELKTGPELRSASSPASPPSTRNDGPTPLRKLRSEGFDAFFWSQAAITKFVLPYYLPIHGVERVLKLQRDMQEAGVIGVLHERYSQSDLARADGSIAHPFQGAVHVADDGTELFIDPNTKQRLTGTRFIPLTKFLE